MSLTTSIRSVAVIASILAAGLISFIFVPPALSAPSAAKPAISAEASAALAQMGQTLLGKQFSFQAQTLRVYADVDGRFLHIGHTMKVLVRRPDRLRVDIDGDDGVTELFYDGKTLVLYGPAKKEYVSLSVPDNLEGMLKEVERRIGFDGSVTSRAGRAQHSGLKN